MRNIVYLSPTSIMQWKRDRVEFYLRYLADNRPPRPQQTQPMSIGSAFDAYVKNFLVASLYGEEKTALGTRFHLETLLKTQVEPQNLTWATEHGDKVFNRYRESGALASLLMQLNLGVKHRFEIQIEQDVTHATMFDNEKVTVRLLGKPDTYFTIIGGRSIEVTDTITGQTEYRMADDQNIILDFKVNGYMSKTPTSPKKGYVIVRGGRSHLSAHKNAMIIKHWSGLHYNAAHYMEEIDQEWATQLAIYAWTLGQPIGTDTLVCIEQLCGSGLTATGEPDPANMRIASFCGRIGADFQRSLWNDIVLCWKTIHSGHIFTDMSKKDSAAKCAELDNVHKGFEQMNPNQEKLGANDTWFTNSTRQNRPY